jgi:uncharacterized protein involved in outer membrane biogenesis
MIRRLFKIFLGLTVLIVLFIGFGLPLMANTEAGREKVADVLGRALGRDVAIGGLDIGWFFSSVDVEDLSIANPEGYPEGSFLKAGSLALDTKFGRLVDGQIEGGLKGKGLDVHIIKQGGGTNLDGLTKGGEEEKEQGEGPDLDLTLELADSRLRVTDLDKKEEIVIDGVGLTMRLTNRAGASDVGLKLRVASIDTGTLVVRELKIDARQAGDYLDLESLTAMLPGQGKLNGSGRMRVRGGDDWNVQLDADRVGIESDMMPLVSAMYPFASAAGGQADGTLGAHFEVKGKGLTWEAMKPTLEGTGKVTLTDLKLPGDSVLALAAQLAGKAGGAIKLHDAGAQFAIRNGWLQFNRLSASGDEARYDLAGRVSLDGKLDLNMDLMPLVKQFGGGSAYRNLEKYGVTSLPLGIIGTTAKPKLEAPKVGDIAKDAARTKLEEEIGKGIGKALEGLGGKKKD